MVADRLVLGVALLLELEGEVLDADREVPGEAGLELVEDPRCVTVGEAAVLDHDVGGQHGQLAGDLGGVQVVHVYDVRLAEQVAAEDTAWASIYPHTPDQMKALRYYPYDVYAEHWDEIAAFWDRNVLRKG